MSWEHFNLRNPRLSNTESAEGQLRTAAHSSTSSTCHISTKCLPSQRIDRGKIPASAEGNEINTPAVTCSKQFHPSKSDLMATLSTATDLTVLVWI